MLKSKRFDLMQKTLALIGVICIILVGFSYSEQGDAGATTACGIIAAACIVCIVWIELHHSDKTQQKS
jgi:hypothetical protein